MTRFAECRKMRGMSQKYVALTLGVAAPSVSAWESGDTKPTQDNLIAMAALYDVTTDYLLGIEKAAQQELDGQIEQVVTGAQRLSQDGREKLASYMDFLLAQEQQAGPALSAVPQDSDA